MKVVISEWIDGQAFALLREHTEVCYQADLHRRPELLRDLLEYADALIVRNQTIVGTDLLSGARQLKVVGRLGNGLDNLDLEELGQRNIRVVYAPDVAIQSVAEHCLALLLAVARRMPMAFENGRSHEWQREGLLGHELKGQVLGLIGHGQIAQRFAKLALALGMHITSWSPGLQSGTRQPLPGVRVAKLDEVLKHAQFVSIHLPLTPETKNLMNRKTFSLMPRGAYLINTSRGGIVHEPSLAEALENGHLAGAALDVRANEPPEIDSPLNRLPQCLLTPHVAAMTYEAQHRCSKQIAEDVLRVLRGDTPLSFYKTKRS